MNRLLAAFTTRGMRQPEAIGFLASAGFGPAQIAAVLGVNPVTVRTTLFRARKVAQSEEAKAAGAAPATNHAEVRPDAEMQPEPEAGDINGDS